MESLAVVLCAMYGILKYSSCDQRLSGQSLSPRRVLAPLSTPLPLHFGLWNCLVLSLGRIPQEDCYLDGDARP
jgi:hypothetical protein